jgi:hypothetical protein
LTNTIGNPLETTIALSHLIFEGTLDRFPGLKICAAHGGGFLPSYANRSDAVITTFPNRVGPLPKKKPTQYLKDGQLYFDSIMFTGEAMRHLIAETGVGQVVLGTDYPFPWNKVPVDHIMSIPSLSDDDRGLRAIVGWSSFDRNAEPAILPRPTLLTTSRRTREDGDGGPLLDACFRDLCFAQGRCREGGRAGRLYLRRATAISKSAANPNI